MKTLGEREAVAVLIAVTSGLGVASPSLGSEDLLGCFTIPWRLTKLNGQYWAKMAGFIFLLRLGPTERQAI